MCFLSCFAFLPGLRHVMYASVIRQIHQLTRHKFEDYKVPALVYVTDGGVNDCTTIVQLVRRRTRRMLLVLAGHDPDCDFGVFLKMMQIIKDEKLASFFD